MGTLRKRTLSPSRLSRELRTGASPDLRRRRQVIGLSFGGLLIGAVVGAYQTGILKRLPDILPGRVFDAERVDASDYAYRRLQIPDALLMIVSYGVTAALAGAGGEHRARMNPALPLLTAGKAMLDLGVALRLAREEWSENRALCSWCQVATGLSAVSVLLTLPEAGRALTALAARTEARRGWSPRALAPGGGWRLAPGRVHAAG